MIRRRQGALDIYTSEHEANTPMVDGTPETGGIQYIHRNMKHTHPLRNVMNEEPCTHQVMMRRDTRGWDSAYPTPVPPPSSLSFGVDVNSMRRISVCFVSSEEMGTPRWRDIYTLDDGRAWLVLPVGRKFFCMCIFLGEWARKYMVMPPSRKFLPELVVCSTLAFLRWLYATRATLGVIFMQIRLLL